jgi:hypothetical protein
VLSLGTTRLALELDGAAPPARAPGALRAAAGLLLAAAAAALLALSA